jgi:hypothetical protein
MFLTIFPLNLHVADQRDLMHSDGERAQWKRKESFYVHGGWRCNGMQKVRNVRLAG